MDSGEIKETIRSYELTHLAGDSVNSLFQGALRTQWETLNGEKLKQPLEEISLRVGRIHDMYATAIHSSRDDKALCEELERQCHDQQCLEIEHDVANKHAIPAIVNCINVMNNAALYINMLDLALGENPVGLQAEFLESKAEVRSMLMHAMMRGGLGSEEANLRIVQFESEVAAINQHIEHERARSGGQDIPNTGWMEQFDALGTHVARLAGPAKEDLRNLHGMDAIFKRIDTEIAHYGVETETFQAAQAFIYDVLCDRLPDIDVPQIATDLKQQMPEFYEQTKGDQALYRDIAIVMSLESFMDAKIREALAVHCDKPELHELHHAASKEISNQIAMFLQIAAGEGKFGAEEKAREFDSAVRGIIENELGIGVKRS